jgi:hypothetical protein
VPRRREARYPPTIPSAVDRTTKPKT